MKTASTRQRKHQRSSRRHGFTLLELLVVIGILVLMMGIGFSSLSGISGERQRVQTNQLAAAIRYTYNRSVANGLYMRMVLDLDAEAYWVEASPEARFLPSEKRDPEEEKEKEEEERKREEEAREDGKELPKKAKGYQLDDVIERVQLENNVGLDGVFTTSQEDVFSSGKAYIHFFPNGYVEPALIYTTDGEGTFYTLQVSPLTGKVTRHAGKVEPDREFGQPDKVEEEGR